MAVERRAPGGDPYPAEWSAQPAFGSLLPHPGDLTGQLESARTHYREGRTADAERMTTDLIEAVRRALRTPQTEVAALQALAGSAATVRGLARLSAGEDAGDTFRQAVLAFELAGSLPAGRGDVAADYGMAVALSGDPAGAIPRLDAAIKLGEDSQDVRRTLAIAHRDSGNADTAYDLLSKLVKRAPFDWQASTALAELTEQRADPAEIATAWSNAGNALLGAHRNAEALAAFAKAAQHSPGPDADIEMSAAAALIACGRGDEAAGRLRAAVDLAAPAQMTKAADLFIQLGAFDEALAAAEVVLADDPDSLDAGMLRAQALIFAGRFDVATPIVEQLVALAPDDPRSHWLRGQLAAEAGDLPTAVAALRRADQLEPGQPSVLADLGVALANNEQFDEALAVLNRVVDLLPDEPWAWQTRGRIRLIAGDKDAAEADLRTSVDLDPNQAEVHALLGELLRGRGADSEALRRFDTALDDDPGIGWVWSARGELLRDYGQFAIARESFRTALTDPSQSARGLAGLVDTLFQSDAPDALAQAEAAITSALEQDATLVEGHALLGEIRRREGQLEPALAHLDKALEYAPDYPYALATRGEILLAQHRIDEAIGALKQADDAGFDVAWVTARLGEAQLERFENTEDPAALDDAVKYLRKARKITPDDPQLLATLGIAYHLAGRRTGALKVLDRAVTLGGGAGALVMRGQVRLAAENVPGAIEDLRAALDLGDDRPEVRALLATAQWRAGAHSEALAQAESLRAAEGEDTKQVTADVIVGASRAASGSVDDGLADLYAAVEKAPTNAFAHRVLRTVLADAGRYDEAVDVIRAALDRAPDDADLQQEYVESLVAAGDYLSALSALDELIWRRPDELPVQRLLGTALGRVGRHREAVSVWERVVELAGQPVENDIVWLATELARIDQFAAALARLDSLPPNARLLSVRSNILADLGDWAAAIEAAEQATVLDDADPHGFQALGWALQHGDGVDPERSRAAYAKAVELRPRDPWAHKGLANALYLLGDQTAATNYQWVADHLARVSPHDSDLNGLLGWCLYRLARYTEAVDCLQRAVDDPDVRTGALFDLTLAYLALGNDEQARQSYTAARSELRALSEHSGRAIAGIGLDNMVTALAHELSGHALARELCTDLGEFVAG